MNKESLVFLKHILENIKDIESFSKGLTKEKFLNNKLKQNAIIRSIEIIGEAVRNLPMNLRSEYPEVSWKDIVGTRDIMIHRYFGVDLIVVWDIVKKDLPKLKKNIKKVIEDLEKEQLSK